MQQTSLIAFSIYLSKLILPYIQKSWLFQELKLSDVSKDSPFTSILSEFVAHSSSVSFYLLKDLTQWRFQNSLIFWPLNRYFFIAKKIKINKFWSCFGKFNHHHFSKPCFHMYFSVLLCVIQEPQNFGLISIYKANKYSQGKPQSPN